MAFIFATTRFVFFAMLVLGFIFYTSVKVSPSVGGGTPPTVVTKLYVKLARHQRITKSPTSRAKPNSHKVPTQGQISYWITSAPRPQLRHLILEKLRYLLNLLPRKSHTKTLQYTQILILTQKTLFQTKYARNTQKLFANVLTVENSMCMAINA